MIDSIYKFGDNETDIAGNQASEYYVDLTGATQGKDAFGNAINVPFGGARMHLNVLVLTVIGTAALTVDLYTASDTTINASDTLICGMTIPLSAAAGTLWSVGIDMHSATWLRYLGVVYDKATSNPTGAIDCWLDIHPVTTNKLPR